MTSSACNYRSPLHAFMRAYMPPKGSFKSGDLTHVSLAGGSFIVPDDKEAALLEAAAATAELALPFYIVPVKTAVHPLIFDLDIMNLVTLDVVLNPLVIYLQREVLSRLMPTMSAYERRCIVSAASPKEHKSDMVLVQRASTVATQPQIQGVGSVQSITVVKSGYHLVFPQVFVSKDMACSLYVLLERLLNEEFGTHTDTGRTFLQYVGPRTGHVYESCNHWGMLLDPRVIQANGLRMNFAAKAHRCKNGTEHKVALNENGQCLQCNSTTRPMYVDDGRPYRAVAVVDGDGLVLAHELERLRASPLLELTETHIRAVQPRREPSPLQFSPHYEFSSLELRRIVEMRDNILNGDGTRSGRKRRVTADVLLASEMATHPGEIAGSARAASRAARPDAEPAYPRDSVAIYRFISNARVQQRLENVLEDAFSAQQRRCAWRRTREMAHAAAGIVGAPASVGGDGDSLWKIWGGISALRIGVKHTQQCDTDIILVVYMNRSFCPNKGDDHSSNRVYLAMSRHANGAAWLVRPNCFSSKAPYNCAKHKKLLASFGVTVPAHLIDPLVQVLRITMRTEDTATTLTTTATTTLSVNNAADAAVARASATAQTEDTAIPMTTISFIDLTVDAEPSAIQPSPSGACAVSSGATTAFGATTAARAYNTDPRVGCSYRAFDDEIPERDWYRKPVVVRARPGGASAATAAAAAAVAAAAVVELSDEERAFRRDLATQRRGQLRKMAQECRRCTRPFISATDTQCTCRTPDNSHQRFVCARCGVWDTHCRCVYGPVY